MNLEIFRGILIPFLGTMLGAACVFFMKRSLSSSIQRALTGFGRRHYDSRLCMEPAHPGDGTVRLNGKAGVSAGGGGLSGGYLFPAGAGPSHPAPAHEQQ